IDKRGGGTTTRQADAFEPWHVVQRVHGVLLTGGSAHGLGALSGVLRFLEERQVGFDMRVARVPIAAAAGLFDLGIGSGTVRPDEAMAYDACLEASGRWPDEGCVGAGMGATVGKVLGMDQAMKSGLGVAALAVGPALVVEAVAAVNAGGDVIDPDGNGIIAGVRRTANDDGAGYFANALEVLERTNSGELETAGGNTVIGAIITNARLTKIEATKVAQMAHDGLARAVRPSHTMFDGDTIFTLATGEVAGEVNVVGAFAAEAFQQAVVRAVTKAVSLGGLPAASDVDTN
ncbi:MAG: P1 family peptidase, partial [Candidatus Promineifilaceae bacterium]|nr:P1 family peptidase [Candidatus Promineifilaceae bacterium]